MVRVVHATSVAAALQNNNYDVSAIQWNEEHTVEGVREQLEAATTLYVRTAPTAVTVSIASPAVVSWAGHGLSVGDPVVFYQPVNFGSCTMTQANPGVVTRSSHGFVAGDAIQFHTEGALPDNVIPTDTYYVLSTDLTASTFKFAATPGGTAINTTAGSNTGTHYVQYTERPLVGTCTISEANPAVVTCVGHGLVANTVVNFATTGQLPDGIEGTDFNYQYYVSPTNLTADTFQLLDDIGGTHIDTSIGGGSGTHRVYRVSGMPTGMNDGEIYYVISSGFGSNSFQFSKSAGGSAVNTTGTTKNYIYAQTGNDSNTGSAATRTGAFLTVQAAIEYAIDNYDFNAQTVTIQCANGHYGQKTWVTSQTEIVFFITDPVVGGGAIAILGNSSAPAEVIFAREPDGGDNARVGGDAGCPAVSLTGVTLWSPTYAAINWQPTYKTGTLTNIYYKGHWTEEGVIINTNRHRLQFTGTHAVFGPYFSPPQPCFIQMNDHESFTSLANATIRFINSPIIDYVYLVESGASLTSLVFYEGLVGTGTKKFWLDGTNSAVFEQYGLGRDVIPGTGYDLGTGLLKYTLDDVAGGQAGFEFAPNEFIIETTTARTLADTDMGKKIEISNSSASVVTIPPSSSVTTPDGAWFEIVRKGTGAVSITTGAGVTLNSKSSARILSHQYGVATIYRSSANSWIAYGDLSTV